MKNCADTYFGDISEKFDGYVMSEKILMNGSLVQLFLNEEPCGYCLALSVARKYKKMRGLFVNIRSVFFDEYQDEDNVYLPNEVNKLLSLLTTISAGHGKQHRRVMLYMASNTVSLLNPYYSVFGINKMLKYNTKILGGSESGCAHRGCGIPAPGWKSRPGPTPGSSGTVQTRRPHCTRCGRWGRRRAGCG